MANWEKDSNFVPKDRALGILLDESEEKYQEQRRYLFVKLLEYAKDKQIGRGNFLLIVGRLGMEDLVDEYSSTDEVAS